MTSFSAPGMNCISILPLRQEFEKMQIVIKICDEIKSLGGEMTATSYRPISRAGEQWETLHNKETEFGGAMARLGLQILIRPLYNDCYDAMLSCECVHYKKKAGAGLRQLCMLKARMEVKIKKKKMLGLSPINRAGNISLSCLLLLGH